MRDAIIVLTRIVDIMHYFVWFLYMLCVPKAVHIFQQESYQLRDYFRWICKNPKKAFFSGAKELIVCIIYIVLMILIDIGMYKAKLSSEIQELIYAVQTLLLYVVLYVAMIKNIIKWKDERKNAKKKLVYTARVKRLLFFIFIVVVMIAAYSQTYLEHVVIYIMMVFTMPVILIMGAFLASPTEMIINDHYINSAKLKIIRPKYKDLIRIGITGSYGKTSTKFILKTILSEKFNVLATPESYNTTMGNVKIIRKELKPEHEVFISEMGARYKGDIRKICDFVYPQIGIITSIGPQHLESFKTIENVASTKAELIRAIPKENEYNLGTMYALKNRENLQSKCAVFLPNDGAYCSKIYEETKGVNKFSYSVNKQGSSVYAKKIKMSSEGCEFIAVTPIGEIKCVSKLLGEHNVQNILGAIAIAVFLGLSKEQIAQGVSKIEPVEHRLQILPNGNGSIVIDDAFNSNPVGSKMALDVLKSFNGRKIVITPGMVELGEKEAQLNKEFGSHMATCTDIAILVGIKRSKPIEEGLLSSGFNTMNIYVVANLEEATKKLAEITQKGDVILFENDLPDNYDE